MVEHDDPPAGADQGGSVRAQLRRGRDKGRDLWRVLLSRVLLRECDQIGRFSRVVDGHVVISNSGRITLGQRVRFTGTFAPVELRTGEHGTLTFGDRVSINFGSSFVASERVTVGSNVSVGPYCVISDTAEVRTDEAGDSAAQPIEIGDGVWLASRVIVEPGCRIGEGSVVTAGSVVRGDIPAHVVVGGAPARILRRLSDAPAEPADGSPEAASSTPAAPPVAPALPQSSLELGGLLISDFTIDPLVPMLQRPSSTPRLVADIAPFGQVVQSLLAPPAGGRDAAVVWCMPDSISESFAALVAGRPVSQADLEHDVDNFVALIRSGLGEFRSVFVPTWTQPAWRRGLGLTDARTGGLAWALALMNVRLMTAAAELPNVFVLDAQRWIALAGKPADNDRLWFHGKIPFVDEVFERAAADIRAALETIAIGPRKLLVLDLDNTVWGGVVGDVGPEGLVLGGHDGEGEAFVAFQHAVRSLIPRGVLIAVASKNDEAVALAAFDNHEAMVLTRDELVGWRINWNDKAANIAELVSELNLGMQSVVFIDDSPFERARVREALPEAFVPEWPVDPLEYVRALNALSCFDTTSLTAEDSMRTASYATEAQRAELRSSVTSLDDWLRDLQLVVRVDELSSANIVRAAQLFNKTNQLNLATRRLTEQELTAWAADESRRVLTFSVSDRLGDSGLTGLIGIDVDGDEARLVDYLLSCRVMGRKVEQALLAVAIDTAREMGAATLRIELLPTAKNAPCRTFFDSAGLRDDGENLYSWPLSDHFEFPDAITRADHTTAAVERR